MRWPNPPSNAFQTRDGVWVQLLGVDLFKHLWKTLRVCGATKKDYLKAVGLLLFKVVPSKAPSTIHKMFPVFELLNGIMARFIGSQDWTTLRAIFDQNDIWYCLVNTEREVSQPLSQKGGNDSFTLFGCISAFRDNC